MSFKKYVKETNFEINPSEEQQKNYDDGKTCRCGYPFDDAFFENADDQDEEFETKPKRITNIMKFGTFLNRYCVGKTLEQIGKMYK